MEDRENVIEWLNGQDVAAFTFSQRKYIHRAEVLEKKYPSECRILKRNEDGSIFGHISLKAIRLNERGIKNKAQSAETDEDVDEEDSE